jgi:hypothetical protein
MQHILHKLGWRFKLSLATKDASKALEPLDHPCLAGVDRAFIDDLPLPRYAVSAQGSIEFVEKT